MDAYEQLTVIMLVYIHTYKQSVDGYYELNDLCFLISLWPSDAYNVSLN